VESKHFSKNKKEQFASGWQVVLGLISIIMPHRIKNIN